MQCAGRRQSLEGFEVGRVDYITKPVQQEEVLARISAHLFWRDTQLQLEQLWDESEDRVKERTAELREANQQPLAEITERKRAEAALQQRTAELEMFNKAMVDREMRIIEMKEVNQLCEELGGEPAYPPIWRDSAEEK